MSKIPRVVLAAGLGVGTFLAVDNAIEREPQATYAVEHVNTCVAALGDTAISASVLQATCARYDDQFKPTSLGEDSDQNRTLTYKLPSPVELLMAESGEAALIDQNIIQSNANARGEELAVAGIAGLAVALVVGNLKPVRRLDNVPLRRRKVAKPTSTRAKQTH